MTILVLNHRPIAELIPKWLEALEHDLVLITARYALDESQLKYGLTGYREVIIIDDYEGPEFDEQINDAIQRYDFDRIISSAEIDVIRAAKIRDVIGIPGQDLLSAEAYRDKYTMKSMVEKSDLPVSPMQKVVNEAEILNFAKTYNFPVVIKPRTSAGSIGVQVLKTDEEVKEWSRINFNNKGYEFIVEAWVSGSFYSIDGLMEKQEVIHAWPHRTSANLTTVSEGRPLLSYMLLETDPLSQRLISFVREVVKLLPGPKERTAFHAEVFQTDEDELVLCEIACRPGGCGHVPTYEIAFGFNLYCESLKGQTGLFEDNVQPKEKPEKIAGYAWFPPKRGRLKSIPTNCPFQIVSDYSVFGEIGKAYTKSSHVSDSVAQMLISAPSTLDLKNVMEEIAEWWESSCVWEPV